MNIRSTRVRAPVAAAALVSGTAVSFGAPEASAAGCPTNAQVVCWSFPLPTRTGSNPCATARTAGSTSYYCTSSTGWCDQEWMKQQSEDGTIAPLNAIDGFQFTAPR
ncbi:hypothetical protein FHX82_001339 [Amycolatopsis bartoniae]|uniref:Uncharacterized protein n=1 Tax=Amycolatopsis bartoniae TaxID=941986 RepID=A0A8H9IXZ8_9PSEU|nr:hypothetical protein [Amycolatopsis bartoniae]MBB2934319.1 hypothetical protein [Amycolatopsis bartoniae]GHF48213.1 hypothetical protein GCM10017566_21920 [Amycolatopsis bartoniae]